MAGRLDAASGILETPPPMPRRAIAWLVAIAAILSLSLAISHDLRERFISQRRQGAMEGYEQTDESMTEYSHGKGLFLRFLNLPDKIAYYSINAYFRSVYAIYPQRVLVAEPDVTISTWPQLEAANFDPDNGWLNQHGIRAVVTYTYHPDQTITLSVRWAKASSQSK